MTTNSPAVRYPRKEGLRRPLFILHLLSVVLIMGAVSPQRASGYVMQDPASFPVVHSRCMSPARGRILTSVGGFSDNTKDFEVVADTRIAPLSPWTSVGYQAPSISIFDKTCHLVWFQSYPFSSEIGFQVLKIPGGPALFVSVVDLEPADEVVYENELLVGYGDGSVGSVVNFGSDKFSQTYVGYIYADGDFGVATLLYRWDKGPFPILAGKALAYRWRPFIFPINPKGPPSYLAVGPTVLDAKEIATLKLPAIPQHPPYPLMKFVFGDDYEN